MELNSLWWRIIFTILLLAVSLFGQTDTPTLKKEQLCTDLESNLEFFDAVRFLPVRFKDYRKDSDTIFGYYTEKYKTIIYTRELPLKLLTESRIPSDFRSGAYKQGSWALFYVRCVTGGTEQNVLLMAERIEKNKK